jgi:hypothetical protein
MIINSKLACKFAISQGCKQYCKLVSWMENIRIYRIVGNKGKIAASDFASNKTSKFAMFASCK